MTGTWRRPAAVLASRKCGARHRRAWQREWPAYVAGMKTLWSTGLLAAALSAGCGGQPKEAPAPATNAASGNPLTAPVDYVGAIGQAQKQAAKVVELVQVQQAIRQFQAAEDRYPKTLDELVKAGYLPALPRLPAGMKFDYNPATGQVRAVPAQ